MSSTLKAKIEAKELGAYQQLMDADPTKRKTYIPWLCDLFLNHGLLLEDLPKASAYLPVFHQHKNNLSNTADGKPGRKIGSYSSLPQLYRAVAQYLPEEVQDPEQDLAADAPQDIIELFHENGLRIVIPLSSAAATREGRGTQWCTAYGTAPNHFWNYASKSPLLIVRTQDQTNMINKYQLHFGLGQFNDEADEEIDLGYLAYLWPDLWIVLRPYAEHAVTQYGELLEFVPKELLDEKMCLAAVMQDGRALENVPEELVDGKMCLAAVMQYGWVLKYVPKELRDEGMCLAAVMQDGRALELVPEELLDRNMYLAAVTQNGSALYYVPEELRDEAMCLAAVMQDGGVLEYVPEELRDRKMCLAAVMRTGWALGDVPEELRDEAMCLAAVMQDGSALERVPEKLRDRKMCMASVTKNGRALEFVPEELRDEKICLATVMQYGEALNDVPKEQRSWDICKAAVDSLLQKAQEKKLPVRFNIFHLIPNKWQDAIAKECGIGFDAKGFMTVKPPEPNVPRRGIGRVGTPMPPALQAA